MPVSTPELAILKSTKQRGFASVAIIAYRGNTGELIAQSGPFIGRTVRDDYWIFGLGPRTIGNIPPPRRGNDLHRDQLNLLSFVSLAHACDGLRRGASACALLPSVRL